MAETAKERRQPQELLLHGCLEHAHHHPASATLDIAWQVGDGVLVAVVTLFSVLSHLHGHDTAVEPLGHLRPEVDQVCARLCELARLGVHIAIRRERVAIALATLVVQERPRIERTVDGGLCDHVHDGLASRILGHIALLVLLDDDFRALNDEAVSVVEEAAFATYWRLLGLLYSSSKSSVVSKHVSSNSLECVHSDPMPLGYRKWSSSDFVRSQSHVGCTKRLSRSAWWRFADALLSDAIRSRVSPTLTEQFIVVLIDGGRSYLLPQLQIVEAQEGVGWEIHFPIRAPGGIAI